MKYMLMMNTPGGGPYQIASWPKEDLMRHILAGYWIVDVESKARAIEIAAEASAAPGKGGVPLNLVIEMREVMSAPPID